MKRSERILMKKWIKTWQKTGKALEDISRAELAGFKYAANWKAVDALLDSAAHRKRTLPRTSGMVIMQSYFMKWRTL